MCRNKNSSNDKMAAPSTELVLKLPENTAHSMEAEVIFGAESDLQKRFTGCRKNPGHQKFIPVKDFTLEHLPAEFRDQDLFDCVQAMASLTCRLSVQGVSQKRPEYFPGSSSLYPFSTDVHSNTTIVGTGYIDKMSSTISDKCPCQVCLTSETPCQQYVKMYIKTAAHVVYDQYEAERTTCHFFFDQGIRPLGCPGVVSLSADKLLDSLTLHDTSWMIVYTHDIRLGDLFRSMLDRRIPLVKMVLTKLMDTPRSQTKHTSFMRDFILSFHKNRDWLMKAFDSLALEEEILDSSDPIFVSFSEIEKLKTLLKDSQVNRIEDQNKTFLLVEKVRAVLATLSSCFEENQSVSITVGNKIASEKIRINTIWEEAEKEIVCFLSVLRTESVFFLKFMGDSPLSKRVFEKIKLLENIKEALIQSLLHDLELFVALIINDLLLLKKIIICSNESSKNREKRTCESLKYEIEKLEFSLVEIRAILVCKAESSENNYLYSSDTWNEELERQFNVIQLCFLDSWAVYQTQCQKASPDCSISSASTPSLLLLNLKSQKATMNIRKLFLVIMLKVRESICLCIREINSITRNGASTEIEEKSCGRAKEIDLDIDKDIRLTTSPSTDKPPTNTSDNVQSLVIMVSHPHGASKHVSVGYLDLETLVNFGYDILSYKFGYSYGQVVWAYSTPTCPGSSGAPVVVLACQSSGAIDNHCPSVQPYPFCTHSGCCGQRNLSTWSNFA